jgi:hypothetical protein
MTTAWVRNPVDWAAAGSGGDHIHHVVDDLGRFLSDVCQARERNVAENTAAIITVAP